MLWPHGIMNSWMSSGRKRKRTFCFFLCFVWLVLAKIKFFENRKLILKNDHTHFFFLVKEVCLFEYPSFWCQKKAKEWKNGEWEDGCWLVCVAGVCEGPRIKVAEAYSLFSEYPREGIKTLFGFTSVISSWSSGSSRTTSPPLSSLPSNHVFRVFRLWFSAQTQRIIHTSYEKLPKSPRETHRVDSRQVASAASHPTTHIHLSFKSKRSPISDNISAQQEERSAWKANLSTEPKNREKQTSTIRKRHQGCRRFPWSFPSLSMIFPLQVLYSLFFVSSCLFERASCFVASISDLWNVAHRKSHQALWGPPSSLSFPSRILALFLCWARCEGTGWCLRCFQAIHNRGTGTWTREERPRHPKICPKCDERQDNKGRKISNWGVLARFDASNSVEKDCDLQGKEIN